MSLVRRTRTRSVLKNDRGNNGSDSDHPSIDLSCLTKMNKLYLLRPSTSPPILRSSATCSLLRLTPSATRQFTTTRLPEPRNATPPTLHSRINQDIPTQQSNLRSTYDDKISRIANSIHKARSGNTAAVIDSIYESKSGTWQYIVADPESLEAVIIDPVLDFDGATSSIGTTTADNLVSLITAKGYKIHRILETHVHADHLTAASYLQSALERIQGSKPLICIGKRIRDVQKMFGERYGFPEHEMNSAFDCLLEDDERFLIGNLQVRVMHLPGHTPDHIGYRIAGWCY
jgi:hypothetical protein